MWSLNKLGIFYLLFLVESSTNPNANPKGAFTPDANEANKPCYSRVVGRLNILSLLASFARIAPQDCLSRLCIDITCKSFARNASFASGVNAPRKAITPNQAVKQHCSQYFRFDCKMHWLAKGTSVLSLLELSNAFKPPSVCILWTGHYRNCTGLRPRGMRSKLTGYWCCHGRGLLPDPNPRVPKYFRVSGRVSG